MKFKYVKLNDERSLLMKRCFFLFFMIFAVISLFSIQIERITDISNPAKVLEYNEYSGAITGFENRIFAQNKYSIEEFIILSDGSLERIAVFETRRTETIFVNFSVYDSKLYIFNMETINNGDDGFKYFLRVFDLSSKPMVEIPNINLTFQYNTGYLPNFNYIDDYILATFPYDELHWGHPLYRTLVICKESFVVLETIDEYFEYSTRNIGDIFANFEVVNNRDFVIRFDRLIDFQYQYISEIPLPNNDIANNFIEAHFDENNFIITHARGVVVIDISDINNPIFIHDITVPTDILHLTSSIYTGDYIICSDNYASLLFYQTNSLGDYTLVERKSINAVGPSKNLYYANNFIIHQNYFNINVYDVNTQNFYLVYSFGQFEYHPDLPFDIQSDNLFFVMNDYQYVNTVNIFSILKNELVARLESEYGLSFRRFRVKGDKLYILNHRDSGNSQIQSFFDIYQISNQVATLINSRVLTNRTFEFVLYDDIVYFERQNGGVDVFTVKDNLLIPAGFFSGRLNDRKGDQPEDFVINYSGSSIFIRDINDYNNILLQQAAPSSIGGILYFKPNYLCVRDSNNPIYRILKFDISLNTLEEIHQFPVHAGNLMPFGANEVLSLSSYLEVRTSEYYSILNNELVQIGEKSNKNKEVPYTYFFPAQNKMVELGMSGIWVYDIEFEEYLSDDDIVILPLQDELLGNYPNPFNPETTISFILQADAHVLIDIYNIRGQKVKSLVNEFKTSGNHQVIWNGTDENGLYVSSGIYFYKMQSSDFTTTKRMVLLK